MKRPQDTGGIVPNLDMLCTLYINLPPLLIQDLMEQSINLKIPGNSWILSFSHEIAILNFSRGSVSTSQVLSMACPSKEVTLHLPNGGVECQSRIQRTEEI